ncbi:BGTF surface domain-containing protein [Haladaptatus sp.]|uniref:DUF7827 domain-containing protein n=1 Tax=Haladaptatus sp. TaxID=1973141 RepID=UPI003C336DA1
MIEVVLGQTGSHSYTVYDRTGKQVATPTDSGKSGDQNVTLDVGQDLSGEATLNIDGENFSVTTTSATVDNATSSLNAYAGEKIAVLVDLNGQSYQVSSGNSDFNTRRLGTGADSKVAVFDTEGLDTGSSYNFTIGGNSATEVSLDDLGFEVSADNVTTAENVIATASAYQSGREIKATLYDSNDNEVQTLNDDIGSDGSVDVSFDEADAGSYTVEVTDIKTGITASTDLTVTEAGDEKATFVDMPATPRGDIANITVNLENTDTAYVQIGTFADSNFQANVEATDTDDDGQVVLHLNTFETNKSTSYVSAGEGTSIESQTDEQLSSDPLVNGSYDLAVSTIGFKAQSDNGGYDIADSPSDKTQLRISPRSTDSISTWIQPESVSSHDNVADVTDSITQRSTVAGEDNIILKVDATGIYGANELQDIKSRSDMSLKIVETGDNVEKNTNADTVPSGKYDIITDGVNGTFYVVMDANELQNVDGADGYGDWKATFTVKKSYALNDGEDQSVSTTFTYEEQDTSLNGGEDFQAPKGNSTVSGKTNLAPGTELSVVADSNIFYIPQDVTVSDDGTFSAKYNFDRDDVDNGTEFSVYVSDDEDNTKIGGVVNADMNDTTTTTTTTSSTTTTTSSTDTTTTSSTDTTTSTTSSSETTTTSSTSTSTSSNDDGQPGFGVAVSVVALLAAALLALRREN